MSFFIRKAFGSGPIRLNLSKGGLGVSAGPRGARVGLSPRGTYVYGGRYGLYYRKYQSGSDHGSGATTGRKKASGATREASESGTPASPAPGDKVDLFVDTGLTWPVKKPRRPEPLMSPIRWPRPLRLFASVGGSSLAMILISLAADAGALYTIGLIGVLASPVASIASAVQNWRAERLLRYLLEPLNHETPDWDTFRHRLENAQWPLNRAEVLGKETYLPFIDSLTGESELEARRHFQKTDPLFNLPENERLDIRRTLFRMELQERMEDHLISDQEVNELEQLARTLQLDEEEISEERQVIDLMHRVYSRIHAPLEDVESQLHLQQDEKAWMVCDGRMLKSNILNRYQKEKVTYREIGYEVDMDGRLLITSRRLIISAEGVRSYRLSRILDVELSLEDGTVRLKVDNRAKPVILAMPDPVLFAGRLEKALEHYRQEGK